MLPFVQSLVITLSLHSATTSLIKPHPIHAHTHSESNTASNCRPNLCSGPPKWVPTSPNISYYAEFNVPPLPTNFSTAWNFGQTYFIYYNLIFRDDPGYAINNQFVPQLMLGGGVLCGSTGAPYYLPIWRDLKQWFIGAQYFFFIQNTSNPLDDNMTAHAVTGELIDVYEGDIIYTQFSLSADREVWTLEMGIKGNKSAVSMVTVPKPFMGLDVNTRSWTEERYNETRLGCCWELYNFHERGNYPDYMDYSIVTKASGNLSEYWSDWQMAETPDCSYSPNWTLESAVSEDETEQLVMFDIYYDND